MPDLSLANAISPLLIPALFLLLVGNAVIGLIEGLVIARVFALPRRRTILLLIIANYASMWIATITIGLVGLDHDGVERFFADPLTQINLILASLISLAFILSLVIEWPFCYMAVRGSAGRFRRSAAAALLAQLVSYPAMVLLLLATVDVSRDVEVVPREKFTSPAVEGWVYYIDGERSAVQRLRLGGTRQEHVMDLRRVSAESILYIGTNDETNDRFVMLYDPESISFEHVQIQRLDQGYAEPFRRWPGDENSALTLEWMLRLGNGIAELRPAQERSISIVPHGPRGLTVRDEDSRQMFRLRVDGAIINWRVPNVTNLPGNYSIFEFGGKICMLDINPRKLTMIDRGQGPVVVLDGPVASDEVTD